MSTVVIGTAGHIDHGKTALLRALTGIDADRLPEEQARGMTIDIGYAHLTFDDGVELDFVDVPGHDRLIGNMLVGAGEIDAAMLVVAADDGPRPQTLEHLDLLDALEMSISLVVVTKVDLVDRAQVDGVRLELEELIRPTWLSSSLVLAVSSVTGEGIDELRLRLRAVRDDVIARESFRDRDAGAFGPVRLAVDRAFTVKGRGAVVTGTLRGGSIRPGDALRREPGGEPVRLREVQVHGAARDRAGGGRTAINLAGLSANAVRRGDVLTSGPRVRGTDRLLVAPAELAPLAGGRPSGWPPRNGAAPRLHIGTDQVPARVRRVPGLDGALLLHLDRPTATFAGDRGVLRRPERDGVAVGLRVLDAEPPRGASRRRMTPDRVDALAVAALAGDVDGIEAARIELHGALATDFVDEAQATPRSVAFAQDVGRALADAVIEAVTRHHEAEPLSAGLPLPQARSMLLRRLRSLVTVQRRDVAATTATISSLIDALVSEGRLAQRGDVLRDSRLAGDGLPAPMLAAMDRLERALDVPAPPPLDEAIAAAACPPEGVRALQADGRIVRLGPDLAWSTGAYQRLASVALERARAAPLTPAGFRDATGTSRKYVLAILEDLDRRGILLRTADGHIPGPHAGRVAAEPGP